MSVFRYLKASVKRPFNLAGHRLNQHLLRLTPLLNSAFVWLGDAMKSGVSGLALSSLTILLLTVMIWLPYGTSMMGLLEEWGMSAVAVTQGAVWWVSSDGPLGSHQMRPLTMAPFALAYELGDGNFFAWHLLLSVALLFKCAGMYGIAKWVTHSTKIAIFAAILFLVFPADTSQMTTRILPPNFAVAFTFVGIAIFLWSTNVTGSIRSAVLAMSGSAVFVVGVLIYEGGVLLAILPLLLLWVRSGFRQGCRDLRQSWLPAVIWTASVFGLAAHIIRVTTDPGSYQMMLSGGSSGALAKLVAHLPEIVTVVFYRVFIHSWLDSVAMMRANLPAIWPYLISSALVITIVNTLVGNQHIPRQTIGRLFLVGLLSTILGFALYLASDNHIAITQRTYLFAAAGGVLVFIALLDIANLIVRHAGSILLVALSLLGMSSQWEQVRHYTDLSHRQREIISGILEAAPGASNILVLDRSGSLDNIWLLRGVLLSNALTVLQGRPVDVQTCMDGTLQWASFFRGPKGEPGTCKISESVWSLGPEIPGGRDVETASATVLDISPDRKVTLVNGNVGNLRADRQRWKSILGCVAEECAYHREKKAEGQYDFGTYWSLESASYGAGWGDAGWQVPAITPVSYAWTNSTKSRLQFNLSPASGVYSLSVRLVPLFDLTPLDGTSIHINGHEAKLNLDGSLMTADVASQWLVDGNNVIELGFQLNPNWGVGVPVDNVALEMKR